VFFANQVLLENLVNKEAVANESDDGSAIDSASTGDDDDESEASHQSESKVKMIKQRDQTWKINVFLTRVAKGDEESVSKMLNSGDVNVAVTDELKRTPLHVAASEGHKALVRMLLHAKADVSAVDAMLNTPLNDAVRHKHDQAAALIREHSPSQKYKLQGAAAGVEMCCAAAAGDIDQIKRLICNGVDPDTADYDGRTALHLATCEGQTEVVIYLLGIKCNITCKDRFGGTPLEDAVRHHFELTNATQVQTLLRNHGASLTQSNTNYTIRMCAAAWEGNLDMIRVLAENNVDVGIGDYDGRTPLHLAACAGHTSVIEYLLRQASVVVNSVDRFGGTPLEDAIRHGKQGAAALLREVGGCLQGDPRLEHVSFETNALKEKRLKAQREPKIAHMVCVCVCVCMCLCVCVCVSHLGCSDEYFSMMIEHLFSCRTPSRSCAHAGRKLDGVKCLSQHWHKALKSDC
jgi:ankyrin repeat protein